MPRILSFDDQDVWDEYDDGFEPGRGSRVDYHESIDEFEQSDFSIDPNELRAADLGGNRCVG